MPGSTVSGVSSPDMQPDEDPRRARTEGLQNLFIRLLFCDETAARLRDDPNRLAAQYGLPVDALDRKSVV